MYKKSLIRETATQALGSGALAYTYTMLHDGTLDAVIISFDGACSQTVTVVFNSADGADYDVTLDSSPLEGATSYKYQPTFPFPLSKGDAVTVGITTGGATTAYMTAFMREDPTCLI